MAGSSEASSPAQAGPRPVVVGARLGVLWAALSAGMFWLIRLLSPETNAAGGIGVILIPAAAAFVVGWLSRQREVVTAVAIGGALFAGWVIVQAQRIPEDSVRPDPGYFFLVLIAAAAGGVAWTLAAAAGTAFGRRLHAPARRR